MKETDIIIQALTTGASAKEGAVQKAYATLKSLIRGHFSERPEALTTLGEHEKNPDPWKLLLELLLTQTAADKDQSILTAAETLIRIEKSKVGIVGDNATVDNINIGNTIVKAGNTQGLTVAEWVGTINQYFGSDENRGDPEKMRKTYLFRLMCEAGVLS